MVKAWLAAALCTSAFGGAITYNYAGSPFTACTYGTCPANFTSDYIKASVSFSAPLSANLPSTNVLASPNLTGWTISDALGYFAFSSTDTNSSTELLDIFSGNTQLLLSTDGNGGIANYAMGAGPTGGFAHGFGAFEEINFHVFTGPNQEWDATTDTDGQWTEALTGFQGGTSTSPVLLLTGTPLTSLTANIGDPSLVDYYQFMWGGGTFSATASISNAPSGASYLFSAGSLGSCNSLATELNSGDSYTGSITANLTSGKYCIGIDANSVLDPTFAITFNTAIPAAVPEPATFVLLSSGLTLLAGVMRHKRSRPTSLSSAKL